MISCVACILMHDQTTRGTLFITFRTFTISCVACILMHDQPTHGKLFNLSGIHDFMRSVQLVARTNHARSIIYPFRTFTISCNKLHATIYMVQDNLSTKEHINRTLYVRITLSLIYRNSKMFTHKKSAPKGALILHSLAIIYRSVHLISLCVYLLPPLR